MTRLPPVGYVRIGRLGKSFQLSGGVRLRLDNVEQLQSQYPAAEASRSRTTEDMLLDSLGRLFVPGLGE
ncbi:MAG TPA: hypothetical protein VKZ43_07560, partial [Trueperaceae bacterium]|nr:hypothetical protein [Trueperaceae bacterium]